jgi:hypothetical protein
MYCTANKLWRTLKNTISEEKKKNLGKIKRRIVAREYASDGLEVMGQGIKIILKKETNL